MSIALMFAGQGAQYLSMGQDLYDHYPCVRETFDQATRILGYDIAEVIFRDEEKLNNTLYTQTAMFVFYAGILKILEKHAIDVSISFGLSLGEYGAYLHQGVFDFETGLKLVQKRGEVMAEAAKAHPGAMVAILGMEAETLEELIKETTGYATIANYNTYGQLVVSGEADTIAKLSDSAKAAGAKRAIPLNTSGAFHSRLMQSAADAFGDYLKTVALQEPKGHLLINTTGTYYQSGIKDVMVEQITHSVRFYQMIERLLQDGVDTFIEIGPKTTLTGFVKKISKEATLLNIENMESLNHTLQVLEV